MVVVKNTDLKLLDYFHQINFLFRSKKNRCDYTFNIIFSKSGKGQ